MDQRLPFYMVYQTPLYDDEMMVRQDYDYLKSVYPDTAKKILPYIEEECEKLEYDGSMMYDEWPDKLLLRLLCKRICEKVENEVENPGKWLMELIEVMTFQELCQRRYWHRYYRKRFY